MNAVAVPKITRGHLVLVSVHASTRCGPAEQEKIRQIRDARLGIEQWWSYVEALKRRAPEPFEPEKIIHRIYNPERGGHFTSTPLADRFIIVGGNVDDRIPETFEQVCRVNTRRFASLEFHLPFDAIASRFNERDTFTYAVNPYNAYNEVLRKICEQGIYASEVHVDASTLYVHRAANEKARIFLRWHRTVEGMLACLGQGGSN